MSDEVRFISERSNYRGDKIYNDLGILFFVIILAAPLGIFIILFIYLYIRRRKQVKANWKL